MLYADDTILLAESAEDLQVQLNAFGEYCDNWKMKVKRSSWIFTDNLYNLPILRTSYIALSALSERCFLVTSKLHVLTKIMVFGFGKLRQNLKFTYKNVDIEIVKQFNYLGVIFTKTCNFDVTKKHLSDKALKAMHEVLKMGRLYKLSVKIQLGLFDKMIKPFLLYGYHHFHSNF
jgi:hypothetical protein